MNSQSADTCINEVEKSLIQQLADGDIYLEYKTEYGYDKLRSILSESFPNDKGSLHGNVGLYCASKSKAYSFGRSEEWCCIGNHPKNKNLPIVPLPNFFKKLIGYKLIKPEYEGAVVKIVNKVFALDDALFTDANQIEALRKAGVLELWFEPVYKVEEPKDTVFEIPCDGDPLHIIVSKKGIYSVDRAKYLNPVDLRVLISKLGDISGIKYTYNSNHVSNSSNCDWTVGIPKINIGCCTGIAVEDIIKVLNEYDKYQQS